MASNEDVIRLVLVSPGDVAAERAAAEGVIAELNRTVAANRLVLWRWETGARPGLHLQGPQGLIDDLMDLPNADVVIGVFWRRFGTPTADADSGTEYELRRAWAAWRQHGHPDVMVYFCTRAYTPVTSDETAQWGRVLDFQRDLPKEQLWWTYNEPRQFTDLLREHLTRYVLERDARPTPRPRRAYDSDAGAVRSSVAQSAASLTGGDDEPAEIDDDLRAQHRRARLPRRRRLATVAAGVALAVATGVVVWLAVAADRGASGVLAVKQNGCVSADDTDGSCASAHGLGGAHAVAISPDGDNLYVASSGEGSLTAFDRDQASGSLRPQTGPAGCFARDGPASACTDVPALAGAQSVAVSPDGRSVYVAATDSSALVIFRRDVEGGALTALAGRAGCISREQRGCRPGRALRDAEGVVVSPKGENVYVASYVSNAVATFDRNQRTGELEQKDGREGCAAYRGGPSCTPAPAMDGPETLTISRDGKNVYVPSDGSQSVTVFDRDAGGALKSTGCVSAAGTVGQCERAPALAVPDGASSVAVTPDGKNVYVASATGGGVVVLARDERGALTPKPGPRGLGRGLSVTVSPDGRSVYVASYAGGTLEVFDRDQRDGALRPKTGRERCFSPLASKRCTNVTTLAGASAVTVSPDGRNVYVSSSKRAAVTVFDRR